MNIDDLLKQIKNEIIAYRRYFHMHPELSMEEFRTQKKIMEILDEYTIKYKIAATTGVVAFINGKSKGKTVALRADTDALPIIEKNDCLYKSQNKGVMHACGHDAHTAILLGVAIILHKLKDSFDGQVKLFFQPNEEVSSGANDIIKEGFMFNPDVEFITGLHVMPNIKVGKIEIKHGQLNASSTAVNIEVLGKSAHGAYPERGVDAILVASSIIQNLQTIFTRELSPLTQSVLSFGKIQGGTQNNIIADKVTISGTLRTVDNETKDFIKNRIIDISTNIAKSQNGDANIRFSDGYPILENDEMVTDVIIRIAKETIGEENIVYKKHPSMGVEDFGYYQEYAKGAFFHLGCGNKEINSSLHSDIFDIDEGCLNIGIKLQVLNTLSLLTFK